MRKNLLLSALILLTLSTINYQLSTAGAQGTAFTYQGRLNDGGNPANGIYDIRAGLFTTNTGGTVFAGPITNVAVTVSNGLFTIPLDYGAVFDGTTFWLQVAVRTNGGGAFTVLSPRQQLTPTPYAIFSEGANAAGLSGTVPSANLGGAYGSAVNFTNPANTFTGNGSGLSGVNAATLGGLASSNFWITTGNGGTSPTNGNFLGTVDNQPLELRVNGSRAFRLEPIPNASNISNMVNVVAGSPINSVTPGFVGATIAGGGSSLYIVPGVLGNSVRNDFGTIGGGGANIVSGGFGTIAGGRGNNIGIFGFGTIGGGVSNNAAGSGATIGGGSGNVALGTYSMVPGGTGNSAGGYASCAAGQNAQTSQNNTFIWGDGSQNPFTGAGVDSTFNVLASGGLFLYNGTNGVHVDGLGNNDGTIDFSLKFGGALSSGEGIASKRTAGGNQYGLDFYTASANRMCIDKNGRVGIGTTTPGAKLDVNGEFMVVEGSSGVQCYIGDDGSGNDVQVGSLLSGISTVSFYNETDGAFMHIACSSITIHGGADLAEPFQISARDGVIPQGAVVVIDDSNPGRLKLSDHPYDTRVAGVVSGANGINPGIQMQQQELLAGGKNVALTGRVYVRADTSNGEIKPGDLLTTSSHAGCAMKVTDHARAQGAILGKAMTGLREDEGTVLILVSLQ